MKKISILVFILILARIWSRLVLTKKPSRLVSPKREGGCLLISPNPKERKLHPHFIMNFAANIGYP